MCVIEMGYPGAETLVDSVTESPRSRFHGHDLGTEQAHTEYIEGLTPDILL
jgi:hypothetical protein